MPIIDEQYQVEPGEYGLVRVTQTGRCTHDMRDEIEAACTWRYRLEPIPNAAGAILKSLDGTTPLLVAVIPSTFDGTNYICVKVGGWCRPFAAQQADGPYAGFRILRYEMRFQQVGGVA